MSELENLRQEFHNSIVAMLNKKAPTPFNSAAPTISDNAEIDLLATLTNSYSSDALAIMPATASTIVLANSGSATPTFTVTQSTSNAMNQPFEDPFGDSPFKAIHLRTLYHLNLRLQQLTILSTPP